MADEIKEGEAITGVCKHLQDHVIPHPIDGSTSTLKYTSNAANHSPFIWEDKDDVIIPNTKDLEFCEEPGGIYYPLYAEIKGTPCPSVKLQLRAIMNIAYGIMLPHIMFSKRTTVEIDYEIGEDIVYTFEPDSYTFPISHGQSGTITYGPVDFHFKNFDPVTGGFGCTSSARRGEVFISSPTATNDPYAFVLPDFTNPGGELVVGDTPFSQTVEMQGLWYQRTLGEPFELGSYGPTTRLIIACQIVSFVVPDFRIENPHIWTPP